MGQANVGQYVGLSVLGTSVREKIFADCTPGLPENRARQSISPQSSTEKQTSYVKIMAHTPLQRLPFPFPSITSPADVGDDTITFCHPAYAAPQNVLFGLPRVDPTDPEAVRTGVHHRTALLICCLISNNAFETGRLFLDRDATRPALDIVSLDGVLSNDTYYFVVDGDGKSILVLHCFMPISLAHALSTVQPDVLDYPLTKHCVNHLQRALSTPLSLVFGSGSFHMAACQPTGHRLLLRASLSCQEP